MFTRDRIMVVLLPDCTKYFISKMPFLLFMKFL